MYNKTTCLTHESTCPGCRAVTFVSPGHLGSLIDESMHFPGLLLMFLLLCHWPLPKNWLLVPYRLAGGTLSLLAVCPSVSQSVRHTLVFRTFLCRLLRYWLEIWYMNLSWHHTDQVLVLLRLTYFYRSYCPLLKFSFPDFSLPSFEILTCILVYEFVMT